MTSLTRCPSTSRRKSQANVFIPRHLQHATAAGTSKTKASNSTRVSQYVEDEDSLFVGSPDVFVPMHDVVEQHPPTQSHGVHILMANNNNFGIEDATEADRDALQKLFQSTNAFAKQRSNIPANFVSFTRLTDIAAATNALETLQIISRSTWTNSAANRLPIEAVPTSDESSGSSRGDDDQAIRCTGCDKDYEPEPEQVPLMLEKGVKAPTVNCDVCHQTVVGRGYHCNECLDCDLCSKCFHTSTRRHPAGHSWQLVKLPTPYSLTGSLEDNSLCSKCDRIAEASRFGAKPRKRHLVSLADLKKAAKQQRQANEAGMARYETRMHTKKRVESRKAGNGAVKQPTKATDASSLLGQTFDSATRVTKRDGKPMLRSILKKKYPSRSSMSTIPKAGVTFNLPFRGK